MASQKGTPTIDRETGRVIQQNYVTAEPVREKQFAQSVLSHQFVYEVGTDAIEAGSTTSVLNLTAHAAKIGDIILFTSGSLSGQEVKVMSVSTNSLELCETLSQAPSATDAISILRHKYPVVNSSGAMSVSAAPISFKLNGSTQEVIEDTGTPANNKPLPVKLVDLTGDITVTANELNINLDHANDSVEIRQTTHDNVNLNANLQVGDADVANGNPVPVSDAGGSLTIDNANLDAALSTLATEATLSTVAGDTTSIDSKIPSLGTALIAASLPVNIASDQTVPVSAASLPLPTGAATEATLASLAAEDFATETTLAAINAKLVSGTDIGDVTINNGAGVNAVNIQDGGNSITVDSADLSTIAGAVAGSEMQVDVISSALPSGASTEAKQDTIITELQNLQVPLDVVELIRNVYSSTNVTTAAYVELVASSAAAYKKLQIFDSSGETMVIAVGAAASEVNKLYVFPGGNGDINVDIAAGSRISIKAISGNATVGEITINCLG